MAQYKLPYTATEIAEKLHQVGNLGSLAVKNSIEKTDLTSEVQETLDKVPTIEAKLEQKAPAYSYGTEDLVAGTSPLATGQLYFVYV